MSVTAWEYDSDAIANGTERSSKEAGSLQLGASAYALPRWAMRERVLERHRLEHPPPDVVPTLLEHRPQRRRHQLHGVVDHDDARCRGPRERKGGGEDDEERYESRKERAHGSRIVQRR